MFGPVRSLEILRQGRRHWEQGPDLCFHINQACAVKISEHVILIIGGYGSNKILKFDTRTSQCTELPIKLQTVRFNHACHMHNQKVIISGGDTGPNVSDTTEVIDLNEEMTIRYAGNLSVERYAHGMGLVTMYNSSVLIAFGGNNIRDGRIDSVEVWDPNDETWTISDSMKLSRANFYFGYATLPQALICPSQ